MFDHLTEFSYKRSGKEAFGFYLAYFLFIIIASMIVVMLFGGLNETYYDGFVRGMRLGTAVAITSCLSLSFFIITQKNLLDNFGYILLALLSGFIASFGGGLLGLIIPAFLTTQGKKKK